MRNIATLLLAMCATTAIAQTDVSLFWRSDSIQLSELVSDEPYLYKRVGHHGPAIENPYMILRMYYRDGGAIDVYSKAQKQLELRKYYWYPTNADINNGAGCDEYRVGKTVGLGGIALWDGEKEVKLIATKGRDARVRKNSVGAVAEMMHRGVPYKGDTIDVCVRITMLASAREAIVEAECTSGQKVQFLTGVNYHKGQSLSSGNGRIAVWGIHPADIVEHPLPIGGALIYNPADWQPMQQTDDMLQIISKPTPIVMTTILAACSREKELNNESDFFSYVEDLAK